MNAHPPKMLTLETSRLRRKPTALSHIKRFDPVMGAARIETARQRMNVAPTAEETACWYRIWRARLRAFRFVPKEPCRTVTGPTW